MTNVKKKAIIPQVEGIEIANPLYDVVFKHLMENTRVASYFIESFIGEEVESITLLAQESTYFKWLETYNKLDLTPEDLELLKKINVIRLDFVATIKTQDGEHKKILIEIQKTRDTTDTMRFRTYLAEQYKRKDVITVNNKTESVPLPIITIYLLGFNLIESDAVVIRVGRFCYDMIEDKTIKVKIPLVEHLTHDCYMVQLCRISGKMQTRLEKILSVFEQRYFIDSKKKTTKKYPYSTDDEVVCLMVKILEHINANPKLRSDIEMEWASHDILNNMVIDKIKTIKKQAKTIEEKDKKLEEEKKKGKEKDKKIKEKDKKIEEKDKKITELEQLLKEFQKNNK